LVATASCALWTRLRDWLRGSFEEERGWKKEGEEERR
jgi:hypothetical protein